MRRLAPLALLAVAACRAPDPPARGSCEFAAATSWLAYSSRSAGTYDIWIAHTDGTCPRQVTSDAAADLFPSFGRGRIAYTSNRNLVAGIWIHDLGTAQDLAVDLGALRETLTSVTNPAFSPDGTRIAFEARHGGATDVYVVAAAGGDPVQLTTSAAEDAGPAWGPDGTSTIYFVSTRDGVQYDVYGVPVTGGDAARVTTGSRIIGKPAVSPDGRTLYYARTVAGQSTTEVVRYDLATAAVTVVSSQQDSDPAVSPAGDRLAVRSFRSGQAEVYVVNATDGSDAVRLTDDAADDGAPSFAPAP